MTMTQMAQVQGGVMKSKLQSPRVNRAA